MAPSPKRFGLPVAGAATLDRLHADPVLRVALLYRADFAVPAVPRRLARNPRGLGPGLRASAADRRILDGFVELHLARGGLTPTVALGLGRALVAPTLSTSRPQEPA